MFKKAKSLIARINKAGEPWIDKTSMAMRDAWANMEGRHKAGLAALALAAIAGAGIGWESWASDSLEERYAAIKKVEIKGVVGSADKLSMSDEPLVALLKRDPKATGVKFFNASAAKGPVESVVLVKSAKDALVQAKLVGAQEAELANGFIKDQKREEMWRFVDFQRLEASEKDAIQGLALRMAPPSNAQAKKFMGMALLAANIFLNVALVFFVLRMLRQGSKSLKFIRPAKIKGAMSDLVGMEDIKAEVLRIKGFLANRKAHGEYGLDRPSNILFSGPPGTGKTKLAGYLAKELGLPILFHSAANLETGFVNGGGQTLERAFAMAKKERRCVIFLDEAQDLFMKRGRGGRKFDDDTQNTLLSMLDGVRSDSDAEIIWIVASNFNSNSMEMDEAMLRRFQLKIDFRLPNAAEREGILGFYLSKAGENVDPGLDLRGLAHVTEGCSPADIESIVYEAGLSAIHSHKPIGADILMQAVERTLIGNTDTETTAGREHERSVIAIHEVGHFLMDVHRHCGGDLSRAARVKDKVGAIKISLKANARTNALGFVLKKPKASMLQTKGDLEWDIMCLFGGMANEEIFFGEDGVTNGAYGDIQEITKMLGRAVSGLGIYKEAKLNFSALSAKDGQGVSDEDREVMERVSRRLFDQAKAMLAASQGLSEHLAAALVEAVEMKADDMLDLIASYCAKGELGKPVHLAA